MIPAFFSEAQIVMAINQPEYQSLPVHVDQYAIATSCWELTAAEIATIIKTKRIWIRQMTFGETLQPQLPQVENPFNDTGCPQGG